MNRITNEEFKGLIKDSSESKKSLKNVKEFIEYCEKLTYNYKYGVIKREQVANNLLKAVNNILKEAIKKSKEIEKKHIKQELLIKIDIRETVQKAEMMDTKIIDLQANELKFFRKIINDLK